ncbi:hypothetical protein BKA63DRAFT_563729 [Paraphoma chrysanthemicola]|nr:hypothetical protein BKA63DRAFT_563729 [Paraphoma chrysanthemicola]
MPLEGDHVAQVSIADGPALAVGGVSTQHTDSQGPERPQITRSMVQIVPSFQKHDEYMTWAHQRILNLLEEKLGAERLLESSQREIATLKANLQKQIEEVGELRQKEYVQKKTSDKEQEEKERWFEEKLALLAQEKVTFGTHGVSSQRAEAVPKAEPSLQEAIENLGKVTEKARRDMSNLVAGKKRPEQAFAKWESGHCKPSLDVVLLAKQLKDDRDRHNQEFSLHMVELVRREELIKLREDYQASQSEKLRKDRESLTEEQRIWRITQSQKLRGIELRIVQRVWREQQEPKLRTQIWEEAKSEGYIDAQQDLNLEIARKCDEARRTGMNKGHATGYRAGLEDSRTKASTGLQAKLIEAHAKGYSDGLQDGRDARRRDDGERTRKIYANGLQEGRETGRAEGLAEGLADLEEKLNEMHDDAFYAGMHLGIQMPSWPVEKRLKTDGTANMECTYWWGRKLAYHLKKRGCLQNPHSVWYGAEDEQNELHKLCLHRCGWNQHSPPKYWNGIRDGIIVRDEDEIILPGWQPPARSQLWQ